MNTERGSVCITNNDQNELVHWNLQNVACRNGYSSVAGKCDGVFSRIPLFLFLFSLFSFQIKLTY